MLFRSQILDVPPAGQRADLVGEKASATIPDVSNLADKSMEMAFPHGVELPTFHRIEVSYIRVKVTNLKYAPARRPCIGTNAT